MGSQNIQMAGFYCSLVSSGDSSLIGAMAGVPQTRYNISDWWTESMIGMTDPGGSVDLADTSETPSSMDLPSG